MQHQHNFEDFFGTGYDVCSSCHQKQRSRDAKGNLTHSMGDDGELIPVPTPPIKRESNVRIRVVYASGKVANY